MDGLGIYVVEQHGTGARWVVVSTSASDAVAEVVDAGLADTVEVGRLGDYNPGEMGMRMTLDQSVIARQA